MVRIDEPVEQDGEFLRGLRPALGRGAGANAEGEEQRDNK
jgi:hypothetical protein